MQALLFLTLRTLVNSIKRNLRSPRRMLGVLYIAAFYMWMLRNIFWRRAMPMPTHSVFKGLPPVDSVYTAVFLAFMLMSLLALLTAARSATAFSPADVDVLFPTPVMPRHVVMFRLFRNYLSALLAPALVLIILAPAMQSLIGLVQNLTPEQQEGLHRLPMSLLLSWIVLGVMCTNAVWALSLWGGRGTRGYRTMRWVVGIALTAVAILSITAFHTGADAGWANLVKETHQGVSRWLFLPITVACEAAMSPMTGATATPWFGALLGLCGFALYGAMSQADWLYEQVATAGFGSAGKREAMQRGDLHQLAADRARSGKLKAHKLWLLDSIPWRGASAIVWRECLLTFRGALGIVILGVVISLGYSLVLGLVGVPGLAGMGAGTFMLFIIGILITRAGFQEFMRHVDVQKALPLKFWKMLLAEAVARALIVMASAIPMIIAAIVLDFKLETIGFALIGWLVLPIFMILLSSVQVAIMLLFPDISDPTQRAFRELVVTMATMVSILPCIVVGVLLGFVSGSVPVGILGSAVTAGAVGALALWAGSELYAGFNPAE